MSDSGTILNVINCEVPCALAAFFRSTCFLSCDMCWFFFLGLCVFFFRASCAGGDPFLRVSVGVLGVAVAFFFGGGGGGMGVFSGGPLAVVVRGIWVL